MRQAARMLGWTTNLIVMIVLMLLVFLGYSLADTLILKQGIRFEEHQSESYEEGIQLSIPFIVNNTGRFPISNVILATNISDYKGTWVTGSETILPHVPEGSVSRETQILHINMVDVSSDELSHLLLKDSQLKADIAIRFTYAHLVSFRIQPSNMSFPWGAPLHNLSVGKPTGVTSFNASHYKVYLPLSFENHAPLSLMTIRLKLLNDQGKSLASMTTKVNVHQWEGFADSLEIFIEEQNLQRLTEKGFVRLHFQTSEFSFGPVEMSYG